MPATPRFLTAVRLLAAAAVAAAAFGAFLFVREWRRPPAPRTIEARLTGVAWGPLAAKPAPSSRPARGFRLAAILPFDDDSAPAGKRDSGVVHLLAGRTRVALGELTAAAETSNDAQVWSDLSAACIVAAKQFDSLERIADALTAADAALALDARLPEALFNRALAIETLGLRDDARLAWERYLAVDAGSEWAREAREHAARLTPVEPFGELLLREYETLSRDAAAAFALARRYPEESRRWGEARILARWADAESRGDRDGASRHLGLARNFSLALSSVNEDRMLRRAVAAIDAADARHRAALVAAHIALGKAHDTYNKDEQPVEAEKLFREAAANFEAGGSPMALAARYYAANMVYEQGRAEEALALLGPLLEAASPDLPSLRAGILWGIGLCHYVAARWGLHLESWTESIAIFERLGEQAQATVLRGMLAATYERLGDLDSAWKHRTVALRGLGRFSNFRLQQALSSVSRGAMMRRQWRTALSFLDLEIAIGRRVHDPVLFADALLVRAMVRDRAGDGGGARADLTEAHAAIGEIADAAFHARLRAKELAALASVESAPAAAIALLTEAIAFHSAKDLRVRLPSLYLQRARAFRDSGDLASAWADLERGIAELESHRESLPAGEARWGVFHAAEELFEDAIDLALRRKDVRAAFAMSERARARSLLETYGPAPAFDHVAVPADTLVVEYAVLPSRLVIFTADAASIEAVTVPFDHAAFERDVQSFLEALSANDGPSAKSLGTSLYARILEPVKKRTEPAGRLVFVADRSLMFLPFGALVTSGGNYLVEHRAVVAAPSAAIYAAAERTRPRGMQNRVVLVTRPDAGSGGERLQSVEREARRIARHYEAVTRLSGAEASLENIARAARDGGALHFSGHAVGDRTGLESASIILSDGAGGERRAGVPEIAKLPLRGVSVVVVAGCSTAVGEPRSLEGAISVGYGFLAAGAPSVIATLWPIDDALAAELFPRIHEKMGRGMSPAEALRAVQVESLRDPHGSTALWAAVQVWGS